MGHCAQKSLHLWVPTNPCCCLILLMKALLWDRSGWKFSIPIKMCKLNRGSWLSTLALANNAVTSVLRHPINYEKSFLVCFTLQEYPRFEFNLFWSYSEFGFFIRLVNYYEYPGSECLPADRSSFFTILVTMICVKNKEKLLRNKDKMFPCCFSGCFSSPPRVALNTGIWSYPDICMCNR